MRRNIFFFLSSSQESHELVHCITSVSYFTSGLFWAHPLLFLASVLTDSTALYDDSSFAISNVVTLWFSSLLNNRVWSYAAGRKRHIQEAVGGAQAWFYHGHLIFFFFPLRLCNTTVTSNKHRAGMFCAVKLTNHRVVWILLIQEIQSFIPQKIESGL